MESEIKKAFISYAWDNEEHKNWEAIKEDYNAVPEEEKKDAETSEGEEAAVEAKEVAELEDKTEESKDASEDADK